MKENKKYPYKSRPLSIYTRISQLKASQSTKRFKASNYAIVDENGKILEKYRLYLTAAIDLPKQQKNYLLRLRVVKLNGKDFIELSHRRSKKHLNSSSI